MKKTGLLLTLGLAMGFASCKMNDNLQLVKRHYGNGYYVHVRNNHTDAVVAESEKSKVVVNENNTVASAEQKNDNVTVSAPSQTVTTKTFCEPKISKTPKTNHAVLTQRESPKTNPAKKAIQKIITPFKKPVSEPGGDTNQALLVLLAKLISPFAVFLKEGATTRFWIDLICWLLGVGSVGFIFYGGGLLLFAIVFAILIVLDVI
jgi:uncharacterized membrane protein YqaE (UPF0057 family)